MSPEKGPFPTSSLPDIKNILSPIWLVRMPVAVTGIMLCWSNEGQSSVGEKSSVRPLTLGQSSSLLEAISVDVSKLNFRYFHYIIARFLGNRKKFYLTTIDFFLPFSKGSDHVFEFGFWNSVCSLKNVSHSNGVISGDMDSHTETRRPLGEYSFLWLYTPYPNS